MTFRIRKAYQIWQEYTCFEMLLQHFCFFHHKSFQTSSNLFKRSGTKNVTTTLEPNLHHFFGRTCAVRTRVVEKMSTHQTFLKRLADQSSAQAVFQKTRPILTAHKLSVPLFAAPQLQIDWVCIIPTAPECSLPRAPNRTSNLLAFP